MLLVVLAPFIPGNDPFLLPSFGGWVGAALGSGKSTIMGGFYGVPMSVVVALLFNLEIHSVPAYYLIPHPLNHPTVPLTVLPCEVFRSGLQCGRSFRCCRGVCPSDAVTVNVLDCVAALNDERSRRPIQYWERSIGVSTHLVLRLTILDVEPDVDPHFDNFVTTPHLAIKAFPVGDFRHFEFRSSACHRCCDLQYPVLLTCPRPSASFFSVSTYIEVARLPREH